MKQKESEETLKLNLLNQAKQVQKSMIRFYSQREQYGILILLATFVIWYIYAFDEASLITADLRRIRNYNKTFLIELLKLYDEEISFYQGAIDDLENVIDETPKETSWLGRELSRMRTILQKTREERSQVVEIYEKLI
jgi:hypothetical protein